MQDCTYLDFPHFAESHLKHFKSIIVYDPSPSTDTVARTRGIMRNVPKSAAAMWMELPPAFSLILASQLQITVAGDYGLLSVKAVKAPHGCQQLLVRQGISYGPRIQAAERRRLKQWRDQAYCHWRAIADLP